ncbi:MAG: hypothetical protein Kow0042_10410 [Calditrichia bacterium]
MNVALLSKNPELYRFVRTALSDRQCEIDRFEIFNPEQITDPGRFHLFIVDANGSDPQFLNQVYQLKQILIPFDIPLLAIIPHNEIRLKHRLAQSGIDDYLTFPFDKLDIRTRVNNLIKVSGGGISPDLVSKFGDRLTRYNYQIRQLIDLLKKIFLEDELSNPIPLIILNLFEELKCQYLFYFEIEDENYLVLKHGMPPFYSGKEIKIAIDQLPSVIKTVRLKEATVLNHIKPNNPLKIYLKSFLNAEIEGFILYPVIRNQQVVALLMALRTDENKFDDFEFSQIALTSSCLELALEMKEQREKAASSSPVSASDDSVQFIEKINDQLNFGILVVDYSGKILYLNKTCEEILQSNSQDLIHKNLETVLGLQNTRTIYSLLRDQNGSYERPEIELKRENSDSILVGFNIMEFHDEQGRGGGYIISLKDITYSKELQEEMRRIDRLATLGVMASGIAHEIRNPLAGIKAIAQTFEEELSRDDPRHEFVIRIIRQVNRLDDMLKTLFSYAKPQKPNRQFCQIESILQEVLALQKQNLQRHNIKLYQSYGSNLPELYIDSAQIQQVLFNLILNSIEAIQESGEIRIHVEKVENQLKRFHRKPFYKTIVENPYVKIQISDNGQGISKEDLNQIFNPFFTTKTFGTGLGLSIVYQIVKENDGIIYFESEVNVGTDCYLFLPAFDPSKLSKKRKI